MSGAVLADAKSAANKKADYQARAKKAWDTRGRNPKLYEMYKARRASGAGAGTTGTAATADTAATAAFRKEKTTTTPPPPYTPDVERDSDGDGVTDAARVGVPADMVPPPPKVPRLPNLTKTEREHESAFAEAYEKDPDGMARSYLDMMKAAGKSNVFETDAAKNLYGEWALSQSSESRAEFRATMNTALHGTANAIVKRAFLMHLDSMSDEEKAKGLLVTVGGCGAGKTYAMSQCVDQIPELNTKKAGAVWDSAGDQNGTESPWLLKEAKKRGIKTTYVYVSADAENSWANEKRGVVARAQLPADGRMVDAHVFADSYVIGAKNHEAFSKKHAKDANFIFLTSGKTIDRVAGVPDSDLKRTRGGLLAFAQKTIRTGKTIPKRIRRGAMIGSRIWSRAKGAA